MKTTFLGSLFLALIFYIDTVHAARVVAIKGTKALIELDGESTSRGSFWVARDSSGKNKAMVEVLQIKNTRAIVLVRKGSLRKDYRLDPHPGGGSAGASPASWGLLGGYSMNSMNVKFNSTSVDLSGSSFNLNGYYRMQLDKSIYVRGLVGYETLVASGDIASGTCDGSTNCSVDISYLGLAAQIEYEFLKTSSWSFYTGGGLGFLYALGKESNILNTAKIETNQTLSVFVGTHYQWDKTSYIPIQLSYSMFPNNETSTANQMVLRLGWGWNF